VGGEDVVCTITSTYIVRFQADNWNKLRRICSKEIGVKMKVI